MLGIDSKWQHNVMQAVSLWFKPCKSKLEGLNLKSPILRGIFSAIQDTISTCISYALSLCGMSWPESKGKKKHFGTLIHLFREYLGKNFCNLFNINARNLKYQVHKVSHLCVQHQLLLIDLRNIFRKQLLKKQQNVMMEERTASRDQDL